MEISDNHPCFGAPATSMPSAVKNWTFYLTGFFYQVPYFATNESLTAIAEGMDLKPEDIVLSICGSGDQPISFAPQVQKVVALDSDRRQLSLAKYKVFLIRHGQFRRFTKLCRESADHSPTSDHPKVFSTENLARMQAHGLENIRFRHGNIHALAADLAEEIFAPETYSKVYLSNALLYNYGHSPHMAVTTLERIVAAQKIGGLLYSSASAKEKTCFQKVKSLQYEEGLSNAASSIEGKVTLGRWVPVVYRRVE